MVASPTPATIEISLIVFLSLDEFCEAIKIAAAAMDMGVLPGTRSKSTALFAEKNKLMRKSVFPQGNASKNNMQIQKCS